MDAAFTFASATQALEVARAGLRFVAMADAAAMTAAERAACLRGLEKADAVVTAARTSVLRPFNAGQDYADDGDYSARSWLGANAIHAAVQVHYISTAGRLM